MFGEDFLVSWMILVIQQSQEHFRGQVKVHAHTRRWEESASHVAGGTECTDATFNPTARGKGAPVNPAGDAGVFPACFHRVSAALVGADVWTTTENRRHREHSLGRHREHSLG